MESLDRAVSQPRESDKRSAARLAMVGLGMSQVEIDRLMHYVSDEPSQHFAQSTGIPEPYPNNTSGQKPRVVVAVLSEAAVLECMEAQFTN